MEDLSLITLIQLVLTWVMVGILWFTQLVHYPLYVKIKEGFVDYERSHVKRAALLIGPIMLAEVITAVWLISLVPEGTLLRLAATNLIILILIWLSTFLFQTVQHQKLSIRFSKRILDGLITSNWVRTLLWTVKGAIIATIGYYL
ncbi:MAG: hypothetical protein AAF443_06230 [Chlamydiota bacterium]